MDLWQGDLGQFLAASRSGSLAGEMSGRFAMLHGKQPSAGEFRSWQRSLDELAQLLGRTQLGDVGVTMGSATRSAQGMRVAEPRGSEVGVCTEYHLPLQAKRVDVMLFGESSQGTPNSLVVELKQWSEASLEDEDAINVLAHGREHAHPSRQALDYAGYLASYHSAYADESIEARPMAWCHDLSPDGARALRDPRFDDLLAASPLFTGDDRVALAEHLTERLAGGHGRDLMHAVTGGGFEPSKQVIECLAEVLRHEDEWHLLDAQRVAHGAILAEVRRMQRSKGRRTLLVRGGPGTGKTVIAVQLLADALRLGFKAAHSTGGKAFTTALRSRFKGAQDLFVWNMNLRKAPTQGLDLLLVDEAHRIRETSDTRWTKAIERTGRAQVDELIDAAKVTVFLLDENQFMRPDEIGTTALIEGAASRLEVPIRTYDLQTQFRCGGCEEYVAWVDRLLGFEDDDLGPWGAAYDASLVERPEDLDAMLAAARRAGESARLVAGFCWKWSAVPPGGGLVDDVQIGRWTRPWNEKPDEKKSYRPDTHPYTKWATTEAGWQQIGCVYSAQGFEFDRVGVIWGDDLVWRGDRWVARKEASHDKPVRAAKDKMERLVRNAYRVLLTRGMRATSILCLDDETRTHVADSLATRRATATGERST
ncbi:MAG: DUF2075 domain-containing protein [Planctomycetes bacterium]|nr:DUF2075 domain-containing protein [Planctomycetota bacterium]